jgi:hypothetical protein
MTFKLLYAIVRTYHIKSAYANANDLITGFVNP